MSIQINKVAQTRALKFFVGKDTSPENLVLKVFTNNITPGNNDVAADFTEDTDTGYAAITLTGASWTTTDGNPSHIDYAQQTFTYNASATGNRYGYFLVGATSGLLRGAELFSGGPFNIQNSGDTIKVTPVLTCKDATE